MWEVHLEFVVDPVCNFMTSNRHSIEVPVESLSQTSATFSQTMLRETKRDIANPQWSALSE